MISANLGFESELNATYTSTKYLQSPAYQFMSAPEASFTAVRSADLFNPKSYLGGLTFRNSNFGISSDSSFTPQNVGSLLCDESPKMTQGEGIGLFLTNLPTAKVTNGMFANSITNQGAATNQTRAQLIIPLLSGVMGVLIPNERWQLIPSSSLGNVNMEFRFNPNAFFSHNGDLPNWRVTRFALKLRMYRFDSGLMAQLSDQIKGGIQLHSQSFSLGPLYNIQPGVSPTNNW